jgi:hypothetical protein
MHMKIELEFLAYQTLLNEPFPYVQSVGQKPFII